MSIDPQTSPIALYVARRNAGDRPGAVEAARAACAATPEIPAVHYALGESLSALGDQSGAANAFWEAVRRAPNWADAWVNFGLARYKQGAIGTAKAAMQEALRAVPGHEAATSNLGAFMRITGEAETSHALLRNALAKTPETIGARLNLAAELLLNNAAGEALAILDQAPTVPEAAAPRRHWFLTRALAYLQMGKGDEARTAMAELLAVGPLPPAIAPLFLWRQLLLAELGKNPDAAATIAHRMATAIEKMGADAVPEHRIMAHYDLAKFWSTRGHTTAAFRHWNQGHDLLRVSQPFSRTLFENFIAANLSCFDALSFRPNNTANNRDPMPVFIVGMPRSGTTLCEHILAAHHAVHGAGERVALRQTAIQLGHGDNAAAVQRMAALDQTELDLAAETFLGDLHSLAPNKSLIVDKMPGNELYLGLVGRMLPGARIIHCVRDPRDIGLSIWTFRFHGEHPYAHDLADLGWTIGQRAKLMDHWRGVLPNPILTIALEDWVQDFDGTLTRLLTHLNLPADPACTRFYESDRAVRTVSREQVRQPVHSRGLGRWHAYANELQPLIKELAAAGLLAGDRDTPG